MAGLRAGAHADPADRTQRSQLVRSHLTLLLGLAMPDVKLAVPTSTAEGGPGVQQIVMCPVAVFGFYW